MEGAAGSESALPSAAFTCERCSRPLIILDDASHPFESDVSQRGVGLGRDGGTAEGAEDAGAPATRSQGGEELQCSTGDSFVVVPPVGEGHVVHSQASPASCAENGGSSISSPAKWAGGVESTSACIKRHLRQAMDNGGLTVVHPICTGCLDAAIAELEPAAAHEKRLIRKYEKALRRLERDNTAAAAHANQPADEASSTEEELKKVKEEEEQLLHEIACLETSASQVEKEQLEVMAELAELHMWQVEFWLLFSNHWQRAMRHEERKRAMERLFAYVSQELQRLKRTNVVSDAFHIWTSKFLPSINNCRIGRVSSPSCPSWSEVNTGWGYLCLLLDVFYRKCQTQPSNYRLVPRGQFSFLVRKKDGVVLPLHGGGGEVGLSRFFYSNKRFDAAMTSFLECVKELFDRLLESAHESRGQWGVPYLLPFPELPYDIEGDKVGGFSIRLQLNQDERWTRALKHLLIDMKWMLEYIERVSLVTGGAP
ncbi:hypothetical protein Efla_005002 [Eimeria flavescens]